MWSHSVPRGQFLKRQERKHPSLKINQLLWKGLAFPCWVPAAGRENCLCGAGFQPRGSSYLISSSHIRKKRSRQEAKRNSNHKASLKRCFDFRRGTGKKKRGLEIQGPALLSAAPDLHPLYSRRVAPNSALLWERRVLNLHQLQKHFRFLISFLIAIQGTVWCVSRPAFTHLFWRLKMSQRVWSNQHLKKKKSL